MRRHELRPAEHEHERGSGHRRPRRSCLGPGIVLALALVVMGCARDDSNTAAVDPFDNNASQTVTDPPGTTVASTGRTVPEETPNSTEGTASSPTTEPEPGSVPEPRWAGVRFDLQPIARASTVLGFATRTGTDDLWLAEREGRVRIVERRVSLDGEYEAVELLDTVVLDITDKVGTEGEGGLLGLDFSTDGDTLYVSYTNKDGDSVIAEYRMGPVQALPQTERIVLTVPQPYANHNGGQITFGPDGFLYYALGDGGSSGDPEGNGQNLNTLLGSILRIDPLEPPEGGGYGVPADNPFVDRLDVKPEIFLYGVRNPWRFSFDHANGDLWIGDVGQNEVEEIDWLPATGVTAAGYGANLGWDIMEGDQLYEGEAPPDNHVGPVFTYRHDFGRCSVTGGYVYRGERNENLDGAYLFADYCSGEIIGLDILDDGRIIVSPLEFDRTLGNVVAFGQGPEQELYVMEADGTVSRIQHQRWTRETEVFDGNEILPD